MAPARVEEDPVTAEYDVYLTPTAAQDQLYLLQYPNRPREKTYSTRSTAVPREVRIKPQSGHLEVDVKQDPEGNYNKFQGLKWGDALKTGREAQNETATYGMAAGFSGLRGGVGGALRRVQVKDAVDREAELVDSLWHFGEAKAQGKMMQRQTLGGQIIRHDAPGEVGKPVYYVGAFRGSELHLSKVSATVQVRPQFHHLDAEDQRNRIAASRAAAEAEAASAPDVARVVHQSYKPTTINPKGELEQREHEMKMALQSAHEERWMRLEYVHEECEDAYHAWNERMFVKDTSEQGGCVRLKSGMSNEEFLDAVSAPGKEGLTRRRKRVRKGKSGELVDLEDGEDGGAEGG